MDRLYNFFCFPLLLLGLIFISNGFVGFVENNTVNNKYNIQTANQINKLYSEKEITPSEKEITLKFTNEASNHQNILIFINNYW